VSKKKHRLVLSEETADRIVPKLQLVKGKGKLAAAIDHGGTHPRFGVFDETGKPRLKLKGRKEPLREGWGRSCSGWTTWDTRWRARSPRTACR
jgi:hypothetical protein